MSDLIQRVREAVSSSTASVDWGKYESLAEDFLVSAKEAGKEAAELVVAHQQGIIDVLLKQSRGEITSVGAKRTVSRYKRAIRTELRAVEAKISWSTASRYWQATDDLISFVGMLASNIIRSL